MRFVSGYICLYSNDNIMYMGALTSTGNCDTHFCSVHASHHTVSSSLGTGSQTASLPPVLNLMSDPSDLGNRIILKSNKVIRRPCVLSNTKLYQRALLH